LSIFSLQYCLLFCLQYESDMVSENRHLKQKFGYWHYQRRVPKRYSDFDPRRMVECSLRTKSLEVARLRRDAMEQSDDHFWASIAGIDGDAETPERRKRQLDGLQKRYASANLRALARGSQTSKSSSIALRQSDKSTHLSQMPFSKARLRHFSAQPNRLHQQYRKPSNFTAMRSLQTNSKGNLRPKLRRGRKQKDEV